MPIFILLNILCVIVWAVKFKIRFLISTAALAIVFPFLGKFYGLGEQQKAAPSDIKMMSYNVRLFNEYKNIDKKNIDKSIVDFIKKENPDVLCIQEYYDTGNINLNYPYKYIASNKKADKVGQAIFSKYKIANKGDINFLNKTKNHTIFADLVKGKDTIRVYNAHLQSPTLDPITQEVNREELDLTLGKIEKTFRLQSEQVKLIKKHDRNSPYKSIICGDFNNTASSWVYRELSDRKKDAFEEAGSGFGTTYDFPIAPVRIDFILADESMKVNNLETYTVKFSDHFPIMAGIEL
jgi:endonuclease/exonuclease/phosphatase family metal-dependent hydrolase